MATPGPSSVPMDTLTLQDTEDDPDDDPTPSVIAPIHTYPKQPFASIEYTGPVSHPQAILKVIAQEDINACLNSVSRSVDDRSLDMRYKPGDLYAIPVKGLKVPAQKLVLKVTKRKRRSRDTNGMDEDGDAGASRKGKEREGAENGVFTAEIVGPLTQTIRFKSMADWHYTPDQEGRTAQIVGAMRDLDYDAILEYSVPPLDETFTEPIATTDGDGDDAMNGSAKEQQYRSLLDLQALPVFSDRRLPLIWNYKNHTQAFVEDYEDQITGETKQRYVNRSRHVAYSIPVIAHSTEGIPMEPVKGLMDKLKKADQRILDKMKELLQQRPVWLRHIFLRQFSEADRRIIVGSKAYLPAFVYSFAAGPYWKCLVRYGFDPRKDPEARFLQRIYFYLNVTRHGPRGQAYQSPPPEDDDDDDAGPATRRLPPPGAATSQADRKYQWEATQEQLISEGKRPPLDPSRDYVFDGKILQRDVPDFQLCDITDPLIRKYIDDPALVAEKCSAHDGWYKESGYNLIKALTRIKYTHIRDNNEPAPDSICYQTIEDYQAAELGVKDKREGSGMNSEDESGSEGDDDEDEDD